ncbi:thioesterase family protein [Alteribacillus sp. YIM 98480]|uniref:acyl-CoA thioesterase n=1 Tax=Alteribacillus sp. YIM 98480 TaxID=2606599 RepID=UPI00131E4C10|nr:thioesterase family protein [Alteribacillus sp. YIM 98480]
MKIAETKIDVRYAETDQMGVVHHSNYIVWCELGRTKLIKELGFDYSELEAAGIVSPVINIDLDYKFPARFGESVTISTWVDTYDGLRVVYGYKIINQNGQICAHGSSSHVCVKKDSFRPVSIKKQLPEWHEVYEKNKKSN